MRTALWFIAGMITALSLFALMDIWLDHRLDTVNDRQIRRQARDCITALEQVLREEADR